MKDQFLLQIGDQPIVFQYSERDHALFIALGVALAQIQVFETSLSFILSSIQIKSEKSGNFEELMRNNTSKTLGMLAKHIREFAHDDITANLLDEVRAKRNYVVHSILPKYGWPLMSDSEYVDAVIELEKARVLISDGEKKIINRIQEKNLLELLAVKLDPDTDEWREI